MAPTPWPFGCWRHETSCMEKCCGRTHYETKWELDLLWRFVYGKQHKEPFPIEGASWASKLLGLVHSNIWGLVKVPSFRRAKYFVTFIDDYFWKAFCYFLKNKIKCFTKFQESKSFAKSQSGNKINVLSNNGSEFTSKFFIYFLTSHKIQHQFPTPYIPQQNKVVERMNGMIVETMCYMFHHKKSWLYMGQKKWTLPSMFKQDVLTRPYQMQP